MAALTALLSPALPLQDALAVDAFTSSDEAFAADALFDAYRRCAVRATIWAVVPLALHHIGWGAAGHALLAQCLLPNVFGIMSLLSYVANEVWRSMGQYNLTSPPSHHSRTACAAARRRRSRAPSSTARCSPTWTTRQDELVASVRSCFAVQPGLPPSFVYSCSMSGSWFSRSRTPPGLSRLPSGAPGPSVTCSLHCAPHPARLAVALPQWLFAGGPPGTQATSGRPRDHGSAAGRRPKRRPSGAACQ